MADLIESTFLWLDQQLSGRLSRPGEDGYTAATAIWAKPVGPMSRTAARRKTCSRRSGLRATAIFRFRYEVAVTTGPVARCATAS